MKILCDRQLLQDAFAVVAGIVPAKTPKPILQSVLARAEGESVTFFATDLEMSARVTLDAVKVKEPGRVLLPARETGALLREISDATLSLESKDFRCHIESGGGKFILLGDDPDQFPVDKEFSAERQAKVPAARLAEMLRRTMFAAAKEETRYAVNGALVEIKDECLRIVATDGRRLALTYVNLEHKTPPARAVVPTRVLQALMRAIPDGSPDEVTISFTGNQIAFQLGKTQLVSRLLEATFPDYENVIPKAADTSVEIDRQLLESNLRKVAVLADGDVRMVKFCFNSSSLQLSAESSGKGRADLVMDVDVKGAGGTLGFNPDYVIEGLRASERDIVRFDMTDDATPAKLTLGEAYTYVVMPISGS
jgi:DNA polymerase III subunit beta